MDDRYAVRTRSPAQGRGRPAWLYSAVAGDGAEPAFREYAGLVSALAGQITRTSRRPRADSLEAGRLWGHALVRRSPGRENVGAGLATPRLSAVAARREVVALLERLGFAPRPDARVGVVKLGRCPLLEAAHRHPDVVCAVHLGVVRGALEELGAGVDLTASTALQPFSEPGACRLDLLPQ